MIKEKIDLDKKELADDKDRENKEAKRADLAAFERDKREYENKAKINEACVHEWEMRLRAKKFLKRVRENTKKNLNLIVQDGTMNKNEKRTKIRDISSGNALNRKALH